MAVIFCLFTPAFTNVAYAQGAYYEVKESQFVAGVWGTNNDGDIYSVTDITAYEVEQIRK